MDRADHKLNIHILLSCFFSDAVPSRFLKMLPGGDTNRSKQIPGGADLASRTATT
jgi:hypothetical protein